jgi:NAD(P)-dependent dehydrogenase (short-subunit alcohol dehydrogenase family)
VADAEHYSRLLTDVLDKDTPCLGVVHLFSLDSAYFDEATREHLDAALVRGSVSAAYLAQAVLRQGWRDTPRFFLVTRGAQAVHEGSVAISVLQAPLWGLGRVLAVECPELGCTRVDLDPQPSDADVDLLLREISSNEREDQIAFRGTDRHVARVVHSRFEAREKTPFVWRADGSYLIVGGLRGLGLSLATWMVEMGARHLWLVARSEPNEYAQRAIAAMVEAGAEVFTRRVDVAHRGEVQQLLAEIDTHGSPLCGVVHSAVIPCSSSPRKTSTVFSPRRAMARGTCIRYCKTNRSTFS